MRQIFRMRVIARTVELPAVLVHAEGALARGAGARGALRLACGRQHPLGRRERATTSCATSSAQPGALAALGAVAEAPQAPARDAELVGGRRRRVQERDQRAPELAAVVVLALVGDHAGGLELVEPPLHGLAVRAHPALAVGAALRGAPPPHRRRQADDELRDRARVVARALPGAPAPQHPLDGVRARLEAIVARGATAARVTRDVHERVDQQAPGLGRHGRPLGPIPAARGRVGIGACVWAPAAPPTPVAAGHGCASEQALAVQLVERRRRCGQRSRGWPPSRSGDGHALAFRPASGYALRQIEASLFVRRWLAAMCEALTRDRDAPRSFASLGPLRAEPVGLRRRAPPVGRGHSALQGHPAAGRIERRRPGT